MPEQQAEETPRRSTANKLLLFGCIGIELIVVLIVLAGGLALVAGSGGGNSEGSGGGSGKKAESGADKNQERGAEEGSAEKPEPQEKPKRQ